MWLAHLYEGRGLFNSCLSYYPRPLRTPARNAGQVTVHTASMENIQCLRDPAYLRATRREGYYRRSGLGSRKASGHDRGQKGARVRMRAVSMPSGKAVAAFAARHLEGQTDRSFAIPQTERRRRFKRLTVPTTLQPFDSSLIAARSEASRRCSGQARMRRSRVSNARRAAGD